MTQSPPPGKLLGKGRDCDVYEAGPGRVLRRDRKGRSTEAEALTMRHVAAHGYPVPEVFDADGPDIVMQRLEGLEMGDALVKQPWKLHWFAQTLGDLIDRLGEIPPPSHELPERVPPGPALVHLDLHPLNVILTPDGPVVIDWTAACAGERGVDAANTWITLAAGQIEGSAIERALVAAGRGLFLRLYVRGIDASLARRHLNSAMAWRRSDPNLSATEIATMEKLVAANAI